MFFGKVYIGILLVALTLLFTACPPEADEPGVTLQPAKSVSFSNRSGYKVDIYKNLNPEHFDPTTLVLTLNDGETGSLKQNDRMPSFETLKGDVFFPRFKVLLANNRDTGTSDIYVDAERTLPNIVIKIESNGTYHETINSLNPAQLKFIHGYIIVHNQTNTQFQISRGSTILQKMNGGNLLLDAYSAGYYKIDFTFFDGDTITMNQLTAFSDHNIPFPTFTIEKGKKYTFTIQGDTIAAPTIQNILNY